MTEDTKQAIAAAVTAIELDRIEATLTGDVRDIKPSTLAAIERAYVMLATDADVAQRVRQELRRQSQRAVNRMRNDQG